MADLCSVEDLKAWLGIGNAASDGLLTRLITAVSTDFLNEIERLTDFTPAADFTDVLTLSSHNITAVLPLNVPWYFNGIGEFKVGLRHWPINSIASVTLDGNAVPHSTDGIQNGWFFAGDNEPEYRDTILLIGQYVKLRQSKLTVVYNAGYAAAPKDVEQAVIEWVSFRYRCRDNIGKNSVHMQQGESIQFDKSARPASVQDVIDRYGRSASLNF
jgi:hypothetical protein